MANYCIFTGNLTNDPELSQTANGKDVLSFCIAVNSGWGDNKRTDYFWCKMWDKRAIGVAQYLHKGKKVLITGRMNSYTKEREDGSKITYYTINVGELEFMDRRRKDNQPAQQAQSEPKVTKRHPILRMTPTEAAQMEDVEVVSSQDNSYNQEEIPF